MTLRDVINAYDVKNNEGYHDNGDNYYADMRKKLKRAFECLGLRDMSWFKEEKSKDYSFSEDDKGYIFYLLNQESSKFFKNIRNLNMNEDDYLRYVEEIEQLIEFLQRHIDDKQKFDEIKAEVFANTRYPILKRYSETLTKGTDFLYFYDALIFEQGLHMPAPYNFKCSEDVKIDYWQRLTASDKVRLYDELISLTQKWMKLVKRVGEYRDDEVNEAISELEDCETYARVSELMLKEFSMKLEAIPEPDTENSRNHQAAVNKHRKYQSQVNALELTLAQKYCEEHNIDYKKYLEQRDKVRNVDPKWIPTDLVLDEIKQEL